MSWSFAQARRAATQVRRAECGRQAVATVRPWGTGGIFRGRAPLALLLYVASRDGFLIDREGAGFAVLRPPLTDPPNRSGGYGQRFLRLLDRRWDFACLAAPPLLGFVVAGATLPFPPARPVGLLLLVLLGPGWVMVEFACSLVRPLLRAARSGRRGRDRTAESLPGHHWSVPLLHSDDPERVEELLGALTARLEQLVLRRAQQHVGGQARVTGALTEPLVIPVAGISTAPFRAAVAASPRRATGHPAGEGVVLLVPPGGTVSGPEPRAVSGRFALLYGVVLTVIVGFAAELTAELESAACAATTCAGVPATFGSALRWLLQRLLLSDPPGLAPQTARAVVLGWLISVAALVFVIVLFVAARDEFTRNRDARQRHEQWLAGGGRRSTPVVDGEQPAPWTVPDEPRGARPYDVALSFAGADRAHAEELATTLQASGIRVFYDRFERDELWGKDLYQHLSEVYRDKARYCVVFVSRHYAAGLWTRHELRSAQARAFRDSSDYILPLRLDDTSLPGIHETRAYVDLRRESLADVAAMLRAKLGRPPGDRPGPETATG